MPNAHLTEAQRLSPSALIELFTLDTSTCVVSATPGTHTAGEIYRWCSGAMVQRESGVLAVAATSQTVITLERAVPVNSLNSYVFAVERSPGVWQAATAVTSIVGTTVTLTFALGFVPAPGASWSLLASRSVRFGGYVYTPMPIEATGFEWTGQGKFPRPKLRVSNVGGLATGLLVAFGDLLGATVSRTRTFARFLDGQPDADQTAIYEVDTFTVDRKSAQRRNVVEFELASPLEQLGKRLPARQMMRDVCDLSYRTRGSGVNLISWAHYNAATWGNTLNAGAGATLTTGIDDAFGGTQAIRYAGNGSAQSLLRVNFPGFTANGSQSYVASFYARLVVAAAGTVAAGLHDGSPNIADYTSQLILNQWVRIVLIGIPAAGGKSWLDLKDNGHFSKTIDYCGVQLEPGTAVTPLKVTAGAVAASAFVPGACPYTGSAMFKIDNTSTLVAAEDVCNHHQSGCLARFGTAASLPISAFPGIALVRA